MTPVLRMPDGVTLTAQQERQAWAAWHGGGSGRQLGGRSGFRVGTPSNVLTATSTTWTLGPCSAALDPGATTHQGMYGWSSDTNVTGTVDAADATYARKDIVYIQVNDSSAGDGSGEITADVKYKAGTASASPVAPALTDPGMERSFLVGTISVPVAGGGSPMVTLNPARFVAAGAPLPVSSLSERDEIPDKYNGLVVQRLDLPGDPLETYDGKASKWTVSDVPWTDLGMVQGFTHFTGSGWSGAKYCVKSGWVMINGAVERTAGNGGPWGADATFAVIPSAYKPPYKVQGTGVQVEPTVGNITLPAGSGSVSFAITYPIF